MGEYCAAKHVHFSRYSVPHDFDLLTIDTDFNDYWTADVSATGELGPETRRTRGNTGSSFRSLLLKLAVAWRVAQQDLARLADGWHLSTTGRDPGTVHGSGEGVLRPAKASCPRFGPCR